MPTSKPSNFLQQLHKAAKGPDGAHRTSLPATNLHQSVGSWGSQDRLTKAAMTPQEQDAWNRMLSMLLVGGGVGVGARGLVGLQEMFRKRPGVDPQSTIPETIPIVLPQQAQRAKLAHDVFGARPDGGVNYWEYPTGLAAGAGGLMGGWKLMDWLMDKRRKASMQGELDRAQQEYQQALQDDVNAASVSKAASADTLDAVYDRVQTLEKQGDSLADLLHGSGGLYLASLLAAGGLSGLGVYSRVKSQQDAEDANRRRRLTRTAPQPIMAVPATPNA